MKKFFLLMLVCMFLGVGETAFAQIVAVDPIGPGTNGDFGNTYRPFTKYTYSSGAYRGRELTTSDIGRSSYEFVQRDWVLTYMPSYYINKAMYDSQSYYSNLSPSNDHNCIFGTNACRPDFYTQGDSEAFYTIKYPQGFNPTNLYGVPSHMGGQTDPTYFYGASPVRNEPVSYPTNW